MNDNALGNLINFVASCDIIDRIEGWIFVFRYAEWRKQWKRWGVLGLFVEFVRCLTRANSGSHEISREDITGAEMERTLDRHGVRIGDRGFGHDYRHLSFITKGRQQRWAQWLIDAKLRGYEPPVRRLPRQRKK